MAVFVDTWRSSALDWFDAVSMAANMTGLSINQYLSTTATVAANKSEMTLENYLRVVGRDPPQRSILMTEAPVSIFIWHDASEAREPYCEEVPTHGLKLTCKYYESTDGKLCAHGLQSPESREAWRKTCRQKALFMGKLVDNHAKILTLVILGFLSASLSCSIKWVGIPTQEALRTGRRPWRGLIRASGFLTTMGILSFLAGLNAQSFHYCDPLFKAEESRFDYAWFLTAALVGTHILILLGVWMIFVYGCIISRPADIQEGHIELRIVRPTNTRRQRLQRNQNAPPDVTPPYSECIRAETGGSQALPPYATGA